MIQIQNLRYQIGDRFLLAGVDWNLRSGKKIALIGPNGTGKTTLLRILNNELPYDSGSIIKPKNYRIGYLPQEEIAVGRGPVLTNVLQGQKEIEELEALIFQIHQELESHPVNQRELLDRLGILETQYDNLGGYKLEALARKLLSGLGFRESDFHRPLSDFSGGWRMRVYLARLLIHSPDLLLLDEPTNHLDLPSLEWLEGYLRNFPGTIVIVSHDRYFIDRLAQEIVELEHGALTEYPGNYHFFEEQKEIRYRQLVEQWEQLQKEKQKQQQFIDRFRYKATKAAQVQSRIKQMDKLEEIELPPPPPKINFRIQVDTPSFKDVLRLKDLYFRYAQDWVLEDNDMELFRGDKAALVGINGAGKTTLTRLIAGQLKPQQGTLQVGERVSIGYYAQHQIEQLNLNNTVYDEVMSTAAPAYRTDVRNILGLFRFSGDDIQKQIGVLSGGEKARVSLAKILLSPVNFLIMDEPTNHLDLASKEALENALADYDGTLLLISHDRYFLDKLVDRVYELSDRHLRVYEGNYSDYLEKRSERISGLPEEGTEKAAPTSAKMQKEQKRKEAEARQAVSKERNRLEKEIWNLESRIENLEARKLELEAVLSRPETYENGEQVRQLKTDYERIKAELEELVGSWENSQLEYEELLASLKMMISR
ncbi:MAG: ABC-F family ATP-binding cassette domain-containing protein [Calditrichia bacterium]